MQLWWQVNIQPSATTPMICLKVQQSIVTQIPTMIDLFGRPNHLFLQLPIGRSEPIVSGSHC